MSIVDGRVLRGCSGAVGPFPPHVDWMDCSAFEMAPCDDDEGRIGVIRVGCPHAVGHRRSRGFDAVTGFLIAIRVLVVGEAAPGRPADGPRDALRCGGPAVLTLLRRRTRWRRVRCGGRTGRSRGRRLRVQ
jgi:hypothetical protein